MQGTRGRKRQRVGAIGAGLNKYIRAFVHSYMHIVIHAYTHTWLNRYKQKGQIIQRVKNNIIN